MSLRVIILFLFVQTAWAAPSCTLTTRSDMNFGTYNPLSLSDTNSTGQIRVRCNGKGTVTYQISFSTGASGTFVARHLILAGNPSATLNYNLYSNSGHTLILGDGSGGSTTLNDTDSSSFNTNYTIYGKIPGHQTSTQIGSYSDSVIVTMDF